MSSALIADTTLFCGDPKRKTVAPCPVRTEAQARRKQSGAPWTGVHSAAPMSSGPGDSSERGDSTAQRICVDPVAHVSSIVIQLY